jgi:flagellar export protein FliJ
VKAFRFPLDRALHIRRAQFEIEQAKLQLMTREREQLEIKVTEIVTEAATARRTLATQALLVPGEISTMPDYQRGTKQMLLKLEQQKVDLARRSQEQKRQTLEAERRVKLLEKLREKRFGEWETQMEKDQEAFTADAYLARWTVSS